MQKMRYNKTFKQALLAILFSCLLFGSIIAFYIVSTIQYNQLVSNMKSLEATIVDIDLDVHVRGPDEQEISIIYQVDGVTYNRELETDTSISFPAGTGAHYSIGDRIKIYYDPENPEIIAVPRSVAVGSFYLVFGLLGLALVLFALFYILKKRRKFLVTQEEYEKERKKIKDKAFAMKNKSGDKIRWQYFNTWIYMMLVIFPAVPVMIIMGELRKGNVDIWNVIVEMSGATPVMIAMYVIFIGPFIVLSILNRFCFGKVLAVVSEDTLFLENKQIPISDIKEIVYHPRVISRRKMNYSFASFTICSNKGNIEYLNIIHFPIYGVRKIKKCNKNIKIKCDKYIWFLILCPTLIFAIVGFWFG